MKRINGSLKKYGGRFKEKTFTAAEIEYCDGRPNPAVHYAGRFAAKESIKKCILSSEILENIDFHSIEILNTSNGAPLVSPIQKLSGYNIKVSISHEANYAIAMAILDT